MICKISAFLFMNGIRMISQFMLLYTHFYFLLGLDNQICKKHLLKCGILLAICQQRFYCFIYIGNLLSNKTLRCQVLHFGRQSLWRSYHKVLLEEGGTYDPYWWPTTKTGPTNATLHHISCITTIFHDIIRSGDRQLK